MTKTVLILGPSGKIGTHAARAFAAAGWTVKPYDRNTDMSAAAMGCDVIVNGLNPPAYHNWAMLIPEITARVIAAAKASGATVILPGNVYNYGSTGGTWDETTPQRATTRKGKIRIEMEAAYRASGVQTIILRAGNFIDPDHNGDIMTLFILKDIAKGKVTAGGDPDTLQTYCYLPDWAQAAVMLAEQREGLSNSEDVPFPGHAFTKNELKAELEKALGRPIRIAQFPWWIMRITAPVWELARELLEMRYLWDTPHRLGSARFDRLLPDFQTTELSKVMQAGLPADIHPDKVMGTGSKTIRA